MKLRKYVHFETLESYGYKYQENLVFSTYKKVIHYGNKDIIIEIVIHTREIFINKSKHINKKNDRFVYDLIRNNLVEK